MTTILQVQPLVVNVAPPQNSNSPILKLGVIQIICGCLSIAFGIMAVVVKTSLTGTLGTGVWTGVLFIITGTLGVLSGKNSHINACTITSFITMSFISTLAAIILLAFSAAGIGEIRGFKHLSDVLVTCTSQLAADVGLVAVAVLEGIIAIVSSAICCKDDCCEDQQPSHLSTTYMSPLEGCSSVVSAGGGGQYTFVNNSNVYSTPSAGCPTQADSVGQYYLPSNNSQSVSAFPDAPAVYYPLERLDNRPFDISKARTG